MAGIPLLSGFNITSDSPADTRLVLTKAEMKAMKDTSMPQTYFCTDSESGEIYVYNKSNEVDETTGKFRKFESGGVKTVNGNSPDTNGNIDVHSFSVDDGSGIGGSIGVSDDGQEASITTYNTYSGTSKILSDTSKTEISYNTNLKGKASITLSGSGDTSDINIVSTGEGKSASVTVSSSLNNVDINAGNTTNINSTSINLSSTNRPSWNGKEIAITDETVSKYAETTMVGLGFTSGSTVDVADFLDKIRTTYGEQYIIKFTWADAEGAYITDGTTTTELISGYTLVSGLNCFNKTSGVWRAGGALLIGSSSRREIYNLTATVSATEGTVSSKWVTRITGGGGVSIDDTTPSTDKVYSSSKVNDSFLKTSGGTVKGQIWAYEYGNDRSKPAVIIDKPGSFYVGIGADGSSDRIKFGPINGNIGSNDGAWLDTGTFNSNEFYFQGSLTTTATISSPYDHNFTSHGNEFNFVPSSFNGEVWFNYRTAGGVNGSITAYKLGNGAGAALGTVIHSGNIYVSGGILYINV